MDTQENDSILKEIMKGIANINVLLLSIKSFNQNDISKLSQKLNNIRCGEKNQSYCQYRTDIDQW